MAVTMAVITRRAAAAAVVRVFAEVEASLSDAVMSLDIALLSVVLSLLNVVATVVDSGLTRSPPVRVYLTRVTGRRRFARILSDRYTPMMFSRVR